MEASGSPGLDNTVQSESPNVGDKEKHTGLLRVKVEESWFTVERAFLVQCSDYFRALFQSGMSDSLQAELSLRGGVCARAFLMALSVCRGETPTMHSAEELEEAVECASFLQMAPLAQYLCDILDTHNCLLLYHSAAIFGVNTLFHTAALFLCDSYDDLREAAESVIPVELLQYAASLSPASYVALGTHSPSTELLHDSFRNVCHLDEAEGCWRTLTDLPTFCSTSMAGVAVLDNRLYIVGGVYGYGKATVDAAFSYDPQTDSWAELRGPQQPRYDFTLLGHEGRLYAIGGEQDKRTIAAAEALDIATGEWTSMQRTPRPVGSAACAVARRRVFVCFWKPPDTTDIYEYVPQTDKWVLETTMRKTGSYGHCMVAHRDNLYVMRNGPSDDFLRCVMDCYNLTTGQWTAMPGIYVNSKGALFTAVVRGDAVFTVKRQLTLEYAIDGNIWKPRRQMTGFPKSGSLWTCLLRLPKSRLLKRVEDPERRGTEASLVDRTEDLVEAKLRR